MKPVTIVLYTTYNYLFHWCRNFGQTVLEGFGSEGKGVSEDHVSVSSSLELSTFFRSFSESLNPVLADHIKYPGKNLTAIFTFK